MEKSPLTEDREVARELKDRFIDLREFIDKMIAYPLDRESIREEANKRVAERTGKR